MKHFNKTLLFGLTASIALTAQTEEAAKGADSDKMAQVASSSALEVISVYGRQPDDTVKDIPQSVSVFNQEVMAISPVVTVGDVIRFVPTASRDGSTLNAFGDDYLIRGFAASQTINGLGFNRVAHARDSANVEHIEVLKGPAAVLYGEMEPGAVINIVTKQPLDEFQAEAGLDLGRYNDHRYTLDVTGPFTDNLRGRLNVAYRDAESFVDFWDLEHLFIAPNVTVDITPSTNLTLEGAYSTNDWGSFQNGTPADGAFLPNPNGKYSRSFNPDEENIGFTRRDSADINLRLTQAIGDNLTFRASYTYTRNEADFTEMFVFDLQEDLRTIDRIIFVGKDAYENDHNVLLDLAGEMATGPLTHKFILGLNYQTAKASRPTQIFFTTPLDLFNPVYGTASLDEDLKVRDRGFSQDNDIVAGFIQNRVTIAERWHVLAGVRYTDSEQNQETFDHLAEEGEQLSKDELNETDWTTQFALLYDVTDQLSLYVNRSESFVPQFGTTSGKKPFDAEESTQYEIGARLDIGNTGLQVNTAVFTITKENLTTTDPANPDFEAALGEVESKGFEISISGYAQPNWFLGAAYGYLDTEITRNFDGLKGNTLRNTPENTFALQTRYDMTSGPLQGLGLGGTVEYVDDRFGDNENSFELPGHTRIDLGAYYSVNEQIQVDFLVNNVTDEDIYAEGYSRLQVIPEPGRTYLARFKYRFQ